MSRMISSDQRSPSISTEAFSGQPERRFGADFFRAMFLHDKTYHLHFTSNIGILTSWLCALSTILENLCLPLPQSLRLSRWPADAGNFECGGSTMRLHRRIKLAAESSVSVSVSVLALGLMASLLLSPAAASAADGSGKLTDATTAESTMTPVD